MKNILNKLELLKNEKLQAIENFGKFLGKEIGLEMKVQDFRDLIEYMADDEINPFYEITYYGIYEGQYVYFSIYPDNQDLDYDDQTKNQVFKEKIRKFIQENF